MGQMSLTHILLLLLIVLVFFGPSRLPGLGKSLGEAIRGFKKGLEGGPDGNAKDENQSAKNEQRADHGHQHQMTTRHVSPIELPENDHEDVHHRDHSKDTNRRS